MAFWHDRHGESGAGGRWAGAREQRDGAGDAEPPQYVRGWTASLTLSGLVHDPRRLSDLLNAGAPFRLDEPAVEQRERWGLPVRAGASMILDPGEFELVFGGPYEPSSAIAGLRRFVRKTPVPVRIEAERFVVEGCVHVGPGQAATGLVERTRRLFVPVTDATVWRGDVLVANPRADVVLVNRSVVRRVTRLAADDVAA